MSLCLIKRDKDQSSLFNMEMCDIHFWKKWAVALIGDTIQFSLSVCYLTRQVSYCATIRWDPYQPIVVLLAGLSKTVRIFVVCHCLCNVERDIVTLIPSGPRGSLTKRDKWNRWLIALLLSIQNGHQRVCPQQHTASIVNYCHLSTANMKFLIPPPQPLRLPSPSVFYNGFSSLGNFFSRF